VQLLSSVEVVGAVFGLGVGQISDPIATEEGLFFVEPVSKKLADSTAFVAQLETQRTQVLQAARQARVQDVVASLRQDARVIDRRRELEEQARELEESGQMLPQTAGF
jgi:parvulin-like peptidyl-prolyl isomerase